MTKIASYEVIRCWRFNRYAVMVNYSDGKSWVCADGFATIQQATDHAKMLRGKGQAAIINNISERLVK